MVELLHVTPALESVWQFRRRVAWNPTAPSERFARRAGKPGAAQTGRLVARSGAAE